MPHPAVPPQLYSRVFLQAGHGLGNSHPGVYDSGATGCGEEEARLVSYIVDSITDRFFLDDHAQITVEPVPICASFCATTYHPKTGHLAYVIRWINEHSRKGDFVLSIHMNEAPNDASGTLVVYDNGAPAKREEQATDIARIVAAKLGLPDRGSLPDNATPRGRIGLVQDTDPPALLIELGFITNQTDVDAVKSCGIEAVTAAIEAIRGFK